MHVCDVVYENKTYYSPMHDFMQFQDVWKIVGHLNRCSVEGFQIFKQGTATQKNVALDVPLTIG